MSTIYLKRALNVINIDFGIYNSLDVVGQIQPWANQ